MNQQGLVISQPEMVIPTLQSSFKVMFNTRDDSQRRFLEQHGVAKLEQCCVHSKQCPNNVATMCCSKNRRCESSLVTSPLYWDFCSTKKKASDNNDVYLNQSFSRMQILHVRYKFGQHVIHCKTWIELKIVY